MNQTCPRCATMLDPTESHCPQCGWSAPYLVRRRAAASPGVSFAERYRGTVHDSRPTVESVADPGIARGRMFVGLALVALCALAGLIVLTPRP